MKVTIEISEQCGASLAVLGSFGVPPTLPEAVTAVVESVLLRLAEHAQTGVHRPGAWERNWVAQVFGNTWTKQLEPDPERPPHMRVIVGGAPSKKGLR